MCTPHISGSQVEVRAETHPQSAHSDSSKITIYTSSKVLLLYQHHRTVSPIKPHKNLNSNKGQEKDKYITHWNISH